MVHVVLVVWFIVMGFVIVKNLAWSIVVVTYNYSNNQFGSFYYHRNVDHFHYYDYDNSCLQIMFFVSWLTIITPDNILSLMAHCSLQEHLPFHCYISTHDIYPLFCQNTISSLNLSHVQEHNYICSPQKKLAGFRKPSSISYKCLGMLQWWNTKIWLWPITDNV